MGSDKKDDIILDILLNIIASSLIVLRRCLLLVLSPYVVMRNISKERDVGQLAVIFLAVFGYFWYASAIRLHSSNVFLVSSNAIVSSITFILVFITAVVYFFLYSQKKGGTINNIEPFIFCFAYSLIPTLVWFYITSSLYVLLPPPRTVSILGISYSYIFIVFSLIVLLWKTIIVYLAVRFSSWLSFQEIIYGVLLFFVWFTPLSYLLYFMKIFRVPFI